MTIAGNANDNVTIGPFCFGSKAGDCGTLGTISNVTFRVDMNNHGAYSEDSIFVKGSMKFPTNTATQLLDPDGDGIFETTIPTYTNFTYGFKFTSGDPTAENDKFAENGNSFDADGCALGDFGKNRKLSLPANASDTTLAAFDFNSCSFTNAGFHTAIDGKANTTFTVAPNPFTNRTTVSFNEAGVYNVALISVAGQVVRSINGVRTNAVEISREGINTGLYLLSVTNESGVRTMTKVVIE